MKTITSKVFSIIGCALLGIGFCEEMEAQEVFKLESDISYRDGAEQSEYMRSRCKLDIYYPTQKKNFSTIVWFHGGGLRGGAKSIPTQLREKGVAVVAVNYRLFPQVKAPAYIEDAAAAVAWTVKNIEGFGGDPKKVFVSGHSAGGYLASMIGFDKRWLAAYDVDADSLAGLIPFSGHTITHFTVREERGIPGTQPVIDDLAPLYHVRADAPPTLIITGDRDLELLGRYEENAYFWRMLKEVKHPNCDINELEGFNHGQMAEPAFPLLLRFVNANSQTK